MDQKESAQSATPSTSHLLGPSPPSSKRASLFAAPPPTPEVIAAKEVIAALQKENAELRNQCAAHLRAASQWRSVVLTGLERKNARLQIQCAAHIRAANRWRSVANVFNTVLSQCPVCTIRMKMWHQILQQATFVSPPTTSLAPIDRTENSSEASGTNS